MQCRADKQLISGKDNNMTIEVNEKGSKAFYKEVVNVLSQYAMFLSKPEADLPNAFGSNLRQALLMTAMFIIMLLIGLRNRFSTVIIICLVASGLAAILTLVYLQRMNRQVNNFLADDRKSVVTLDESGVELDKEGSQIVRLGWDNVALVRAFKESVCFFANDTSGVVIAVNGKYKQVIFDYLKNADINVKVIS